MKFKFMVAAAAAMFTLVGCDRVVTREAEYRQYKIVEIKRPKHFRVTVEDMKTGFKQQVYVSKRCSRWQEVELYSETALMTTWTTYESGERRKDINGKSICPH